jgi:hypothetical protein
MHMVDLRQLIIETAADIGASPLDLATAISYETGGTFNPTQRGPTTRHGQHRGFIQFGEPQAAQYGVDWNDPINSQLGKGKAVSRYFKGSGFKPGMSGLDLDSTINAGSPGRYGASDTAAGGAPGDVRDKWENQMSGHRQKAQALLGSASLPGKLGGDSMVARDFDPQVAAQTNTPTSIFGSMSPGPIAQNNSIDPAVASYAFGDDKPGWGDRLRDAGKHFDAAMSEVNPPRIAAMPSPSGDVANGLAKIMQNPSALAQMLMKRRLA